MKKFLAGIAAAAIITVPMTSFALESMSKGALKKATGQAGVSIALDNIVIVQKSQPTTTYWDMDGTSSIAGTVGNVAAAGIKISYGEAAQKLIIIDGILDNTKYGVDKLESTFKISSQRANFGINSVGIVDGSKVADASTGRAINLDTSVATVTEGAVKTPAKAAVAAAAAVPAVVATQDDINNGVLGANGFPVTEIGQLITAEKAAVAAAAAVPEVLYTAADVAATMAKYENYGNGISPLTIDVGTCQSLTAGLHWNAKGNLQKVGSTGIAQSNAEHLDVAGVVIGLPTVEITTYHSNDTKIVSLATRGASTAAAANSGYTVPNVSNEFIRIEKSGTSQMAILGGRVEIAPH